MDRFKFRAYIQKYNKLVDVFKFGVDMGVCRWVWHSNIYDTPDGKPVLDNCGSFDERFSNIVNKTKLIYCILEQCTGLKDINSKLIYEGDIVNTSNFGKCFIEWADDEAGFTLHSIETVNYYSIYCCNDFEIIGNIHENPELLEDK